eukprot:346792-Prymnesium_polylepis.1
MPPPRLALNAYVAPASGAQRLCRLGRRCRCRRVLRLVLFEELIDQLLERPKLLLWYQAELDHKVDKVLEARVEVRLELVRDNSLVVVVVHVRVDAE